jgi:hypothetical protein
MFVFTFGLWYLGLFRIWNKLDPCGKHAITLEAVAYYVTTVLMVLGVTSDVQIGELYIKRCTNCMWVQWTCLLFNMQYIQWGQFRTFLFPMVIMHLLKNSDFICKLIIHAVQRRICVLIAYFWHVVVQLWVYVDCDSVSHTCATCCVVQLDTKERE